MSDWFDQNAPQQQPKGAGQQDWFAANSRPDLSKNPPPAAGPHVNMQPDAGGTLGSIPPDMAQKGRVAATKSYGGVSTGRATYSNDMSDPQPKYPIPTPKQDASNLALVGSTLASPFTGGMSLLPRLGLLGAGAAAGSAGAQIARTGKVDENQTAGDMTSYGVAPELGGSAIGALARNSNKIIPTAMGALKGGAERIPVVGPIAKGAITGGMKAYKAVGDGLPAAAGDAGEAMQTSAPRSMIPSEAPAPESIPAKPSGRLVLSPEEVQAQIQQMRLARQMASQRGMQYAAGQRPEN